MNYVTGAYFVQGSTHDVCQDYAEAGDDRAILSDGCSSSPMTDIGARLLVRACMQGAPVATQRAATWAKDLGLPLGALDATLVRLWPDAKGVQALLQGDGHVLARRLDGNWERWDVEQPEGAPLYPSYALDPARESSYHKTYGAASVQFVPGRLDPETYQDWGSADPVPLRSGRLSLLLRPTIYDMVVGASDGLASFVDADGASVPVDLVVEKLLTFPQVTTGALERRVRRFTRRTCPKLGWTHRDDLSLIMMAAVP